MKYDKNYAKKYREEHKEKFREYNRKYRAENIEREKKWHKQYHVKNRDKINERNRLWRLHNKDKQKSHWEKYKIENAEKIKAYGHRPEVKKRKREYLKKYYSKNKDHLLQYNRGWRSKRTLEEKRAYAKEYRRKNANKIKAYYARDDVKKRIRKWRNDWYAKTQPKRREYAMNRHRKIYIWLNWRKDKCEMCGWNKNIKVLDVHHINPKLKGTEMDNENNWITLCKNCHWIVHIEKIDKEKMYEIKNGVNS